MDLSFEQQVDALARRRLGTTGVEALETLTAGANKGTWAFRADGQGFILQRQAPSGAPDPDAGPDDWVPHLDGTEEFKVMLAAQAADVPVPHVRHILVEEDGLGEGAVTERVEGETIPARVLRQPELVEARKRMAGQCGRILAQIHRVPTGQLGFLRHFDAAETLALFERTLDRVGLPLPPLELALRWARERLPRQARTTLVHGDFRTGNFIVGPEGIRAVLDWEIAHVGDPMEDLGYLCMRTWRFGGAGAVGGFGAREDLYAAYEKASGLAVDPEAARFWEVAGAMRWALGCVRRAHAWRHQQGRKLEFAAVGRRIEEPVYDLLNVIEGLD
ncbi:phosphotransferase family protein [Ramlibacter albus]|uniref:Phosphotransferase family protein n=1 Tax=Ramlibacter albus TaxID=2079448 RepID=A0A923MDK7_9BURK|nr:phosphotransferase family protein [Ramlibacter albus]MBC5767087.1 phosphotransferase family protein [Ramlibacter albus]